jgi:hypothetical protein
MMTQMIIGWRHLQYVFPEIQITKKTMSVSLIRTRRIWIRNPIPAAYRPHNALLLLWAVLMSSWNLLSLFYSSSPLILDQNNLPTTIYTPSIETPPPSSQMLTIQPPRLRSWAWSWRLGEQIGTNSVARYVCEFLCQRGKGHGGRLEMEEGQGTARVCVCEWDDIKVVPCISWG